MKIIFNNGDSADYSYDVGVNEIVSTYNSVSDALALIGKLTADNLKHVILQTDDGKTTGEYYDLSLSYVTVYSPENNSSKKWQLFINIREKTDEEKRLERVEELLATQDGAIGDLADAVAEIIGG